MTHLRMIVVTAVLVMGLALAPAASAIPAPHGNIAKCDDEAYAAKHPLACKPSGTTAKGATAALTATDLAKTIAEMAGKEAGKELSGFLFNEIGLGVLSDPTSGDLQALNKTTLVCPMVPSARRLREQAFLSVDLLVAHAESA